VFIAKLHDDATAKSRRREISALFQVRDKNNVIGMTLSNELLVRLDSPEDMGLISGRLKKPETNSYAISCLEAFMAFSPSKIRSASVDSYKIKLIDFQNYEHNQAIQKLFERTLVQQKIEYRKKEYARNLQVYRLNNINAATLDALENLGAFEAIFSIEPMPQYMITLDILESSQSIPIVRPKDNFNHVVVGILDSGISDIPHLAPWLHGERYSPYPESRIDPAHGTSVSGIVVYGDTLENRNWIGGEGVKLFDAAVFPDTTKESIDEDELVENIRTAIGQNHEEVKVWNLSISATSPVSDSEFSDFAMALDDIQDQYNVLICKSAGNCRNFISGKPKGKIHSGADSVRSLVVGSIAHEKNEHDLAEIDNPSPFSRIGPGPEYIIKPEIVHYGGNAGVDYDGKPVSSGVKSFLASGSIASLAGTSYSTPRIASLAANLHQELNEDFDPLLLKSLIIHSSTYSEKLMLPYEERTKQVGFGLPKRVQEIIYNSPHEATLILRDELAKGEYIDIMDFPMPSELVRNGFYTGQIIVTLVYDPILDRSQGAEYCQSDLDVKFGSYDDKVERDISKRNILNPIGRRGGGNLLLDSLYSKQKLKNRQDEFALRERLLIKYGDKYYPVKKYAVDLADLTESGKIKYLLPNMKWFLKLKGVYRDHTEQKAKEGMFGLSQAFSLIITIRDPFGDVGVYDKVTQKLDEYNFWHSNIKIASSISIPLDN
jgi:hypothetical protein